MSNFSEQNVFEMMVANGGPGFWVRRTTWDATCARVIGNGPFTMPAPYFGNPPIVMDVYDLQGRLKDGLAKMPVPGTFKTWRKIPEPSWAATEELRALSDPAIQVAVRTFDRRK
jgi:hypothetical protein